MSRKINVDKMLEAVEEIEVTIGGEVYKCRLLNFKEAVSLQGKMDASTPESVLEFMKEVCQKTGLPEDKMLELPPEVFMETIQAFFGSTPTSKSE